MGLQRYALSAHEDFMRRELYVAREEDPSGEYYRVADVDALIARIRAAVAAERAATVADTGSASGWVARITKYRAALDALLAGGG